MPDGNSGVTIGDNAWISGNVGGAGASVGSFVSSQDREMAEALRAAVAGLVSQIRANQAVLPDGGEVLEVAEDVAGELEKQRPDKRRLLGLLGSVRDGVAGIASLAGSAEAIEQAIKALF